MKTPNIASPINAGWRRVARLSTALLAIGILSTGAGPVACGGSGDNSASSADGGGRDGSAGRDSASSGGGAGQAGGGAGGTSAGAAGSGGSGGAAGIDASSSGGTGAGSGGVPGDAGDGSSGAAGGPAGSGGATGGTAGSAGTGGSTAQCAPYTAACQSGSACCSGLCDPISKTCAKNSDQCSAAGLRCVDNAECCSFNCSGGLCRAPACIADGENCQAGRACCSGVCEGGKCKDINGGASTCRSSGNPCTTPGPSGTCCSGLCNESLRCDTGSSFCTQLYDVCRRDAECCSGRCVIGSGATIGYCGEQSVGPNRCADGAAGMICNACGQCCSRACAPGPNGVFICQPPSGCRPAGELCSRDIDCCGGDPDTGLPGAQESDVTCEKEPGAGYGRCKSARCTPQGDTCHQSGGACSDSSTQLPSNCCPTNANPSNPEWKKGECSFDTHLIPRCDGLKTCRPNGGYCSSSADCCRDPNDPNSTALPCVPDPADGNRLKCRDPGGSNPCIPTSGACTTHADCCTGALCIIPAGQIFGTCGAVPPPGSGGTGGTGGTSGTGGSSTGGTGGAGGSGGSTSCAAYGQGCTVTSNCCYANLGVECYQSKCLIPPG